MATNQAKRCQVSGLINNFFKQITQREHDSRRDTDLKLYNLRQDQAVIIAAAEESEKQFRLEELRRDNAKVEQHANFASGDDDGDADTSIVLMVPGQPKGQDMALLFDVNNANSSGLEQTKRRYGKRPDQWHIIAQWHLETGRSISKTVRQWQEYFHPDPDNRNKTTIARWVKDRKKRLVSDRLEEQVAYGFHGVSHGNDIDKEMLRIIENRIRHGVSTSNLALHLLCLHLLTVHKHAATLAKFNDGIITFGDSWAQRFWNRHKLCSRVVTTKMRETIPANFDMLKEKYIMLYAYFVQKHNIPRELILGCDETAVQLVPTIKKLRCKKGTRRVRVQGVGKEKSQITCGICVAGDGSLVTPYN